MESFFATLKKELAHHETSATREAARASLFDDLEVFDNRERRHSTSRKQGIVDRHSNDSLDLNATRHPKSMI